MKRNGNKGACMSDELRESAGKQEKVLENVIRDITSVKKEISKAVVGQKEVVEQVLVCLFSGGHALLEGVPGLGKTYLIKCLGQVLHLSTSRIQFTPDLMPADILGTNVLMRDEAGSQHIRFQTGPLFANIILADEINRATPKTQSALLEAMQEERVTTGGVSYILDPPFIVLATQNPIEMEGTYPLPEAQMDRFFFKIRIGYPDRREVLDIIDRTTVGEEPVLEKVIDAARILDIQKILKTIPLSEDVKDFAVRLVFATHPERNPGDMGRYVRYGSSPRGAQSLVRAGKVFAVLDGRPHVGFGDIRKAALPSLRHRLIMSFEGEAEGVSSETVIQDILDRVADRESKHS